MKILAIDTATRQLGVALIDGERLLASYELLADYPHAVELPDAVTRVLAAAHLQLKHVEAIAVDLGPGSFTGLRIGLAFVKALAVSTKKPVIGVPSLDVLAAQLPAAQGIICPVLDARQKNVYAARYHLEAGKLVRVSDYLLGPVGDVVPQIKEPVLFLGDGCALYRDQLLQRCPNGQVLASEFWLPGAKTLARLALERYASGQRDDPARLVPMYLYPLDCSVRGPDRPTSVLPAKVVHVA